MAKTNEKVDAIIFYTKQQILQAKRYRDNRDLLDGILSDNGKYSIDQVDSMINKYLKGKVN